MSEEKKREKSERAKAIAKATELLVQGEPHEKIFQETGISKPEIINLSRVLSPLPSEMKHHRYPYNAHNKEAEAITKRNEEQARLEKDRVRHPYHGLGFTLPQHATLQKAIKKSNLPSFQSLLDAICHALKYDEAFFQAILEVAEAYQGEGHQPKKSNA